MNSHYMKKLRLLAGFFLLIPLFVQGQTSKPAGVYYIAGMILDQQTKEPVPYVRVQVNHSRTGAVTNSEGFFRIPVGELDSLHIAHIGYQNSSFSVAEYLAAYQGNLDEDILVIKYLNKSDYYLKEVTIYPYSTPQEIRTAMTNMDVTEEEELGYLMPDMMQMLMESLPKDEGEKSSVGQKMYMDSYQSKNLLPTASVDAIGLIRSLKSIAEKLKKRKNTNLNDW